MAHNTKVMGEYCRLSRDKNDIDNYSVSIENQQRIIRSYAEANGIELSKESFIDDGYTGMNFDRPEFKRLVELCRAGQLADIIVKDLSRLGRMLHQALAYAQEILPAAEYSDIQALDKALLNRLIKRIIIGNKVHLGGKKYTQDITIEYRIIGVI